MFKVTAEENLNNYTKFMIEPLEVGFGHTLGNSLRRVLLTSLEGSAITSVKIEGVSHQFSTIEGVSEDVIEIILNLKKVRVRVHSSEPIRLILKASGKRQVKASDIEVIGDGEVVTLDQHIATLSVASAKLNIEMVAEKGKGYQKGEEKKNGDISTMTIDALFSPVISVNYIVEPTRVGRRTDFDKLSLEVTTDGTIKAAEALDQAAKILSSNFKQIYEPAEVIEEEKSSSTQASDEVMKLTVDELDLPVRITNALRAIDVNTVEDLVNISRAQLLKAKNLGGKSLSLVSEKLTERGLSLREA